jgi:hypothetical protein
MVDAKERDAQRGARALLAKHDLDISRVEVTVQHGICYVRGVVIPCPGAKITDLDAEIQRVAHLIRQRPGIRNVVLDVVTR